MTGSVSRRLALAAIFSVIPAAYVPLFAQGAEGALTAHGLAMHGEPALSPDFIALPQANPDAPKGGILRMGEGGGFDSLNPFSTRGRASAWVTPLTVETLMARAWDEPFTVYGLLAESITTDAARSYAEFTIRENARFADGSPVTVEDVIWSFHALAEAHPRYLTAHKKVAHVTASGPRSVRFDFAAPDRELPLILGLRPVLSKADWQHRDLSLSDMTAPLGSGPYRIERVDPGRSITLRKRADWWAKDLPVMRGQHNLDEIKVEYFADSSVMFEAFKAGALSTYREHNAARWRSGYDFGRITSGAVVKSEIPHQRPAMMTGLAFNTRRALFADWRVRQALIDSFGFEFINQTLNAGTEPRAASWFHNSDLAMGPGAADAAVAGLLAPFAGDLPPDALDDLSLPQSDGSESNRPGLRRAMALLEAAGWQVQDGALRDAAGNPFSFELLLPMGNADIRAAATIWARGLERLGITARIQAVDDAQMTARLRDFDYDMTTILRANSLSPGNEQLLYWGSSSADLPGSRNITGVKSPAVDALVQGMLTVTDPADFRTHVRALDRALMAGRYVIPLWFADRSRLAHDKNLTWPKDRLPVYGDAAGFLPDLWWAQP